MPKTKVKATQPDQKTPTQGKLAGIITAIRCRPHPVPYPNQTTMPPLNNHASPENQFPTPQVEPPGDFPARWENAVQTHGAAFLSALNKIGAELVETNPQHYTQYFHIAHQGRHFYLSAQELPKTTTLEKLASKNRMAVIHQITEDLLNYEQNMFYNTLQNHIRTRKNFESKTDITLNGYIFSIICDFLREAGFTFHMD